MHNSDTMIELVQNVKSLDGPLNFAVEADAAPPKSLHSDSHSTVGWHSVHMFACLTSCFLDHAHCMKINKPRIKH